MDIHRQGSEDYTFSVLGAMEEAGNECLPLTTNKKKMRKGIAGWTEHVKPYAEVCG